MTTEPTLAEIIREALDSRLNDLHVAMPAKVTAYDAANQTVEVQPMIRRAIQGTDGNVTHEELPKIPNVPVAFPRAAAFSATWPLAAGDHVLLVFNSSAIGQWRETGDLADPVDLRRHDLSYPVAIPGIAPKGQIIPTASDAAVLSVNAPATHVRVGGPTAPAVAQAPKVEALFEVLADAIVNTAVGGAPDAGAGWKANIATALASAGWAGSTEPPTDSSACDKLKSE